ncbi:MAG: citrate/2-methylcitrate synthase [Pseudomonadales bacterium]
MFSPSLEGVVVGETAVSEVKGEQGILLYRGISIEQLIHQPQWQVAALLVCTAVQPEQVLSQFKQFMHANAVLQPADVGVLDALSTDLHPMLMLQAILPSITEAASYDLPLPLMSKDIAHGYALAAKIPALLCLWRAKQLGLAIDLDVYTSASPDHGSLSWFLQHFPGATDSEQARHILNTTQVLQMEHGYNASTFAGRVCASTDAPIQSVLSASVGTLYGRLHGGADQAALEMAKTIGQATKAKSFVVDALKHKRKIMGMGHREYKTLDPRAAILKPMAERLCQNNAADAELFQTLLSVEEACQEQFATQGKSIYANVEYYKGAVFNSLGIPSDFFTALFAMSRVFGYLAHYEEFRQNPRLIRPRARAVQTSSTA